MNGLGGGNEALICGSPFLPLEYAERMGQPAFVARPARDFG
jgi:hypothetical protein